MKHQHMNTHWLAEASFHTFLTSEHDGNKWLLHATTALPPQKQPRNHRLGGWARPTASLDILENKEMSYTCRESKSVSLVVPMMLKQMVYRLQLCFKGLKQYICTEPHYRYYLNVNRYCTVINSALIKSPALITVN